MEGENNNKHGKGRVTRRKILNSAGASFAALGFGATGTGVADEKDDDPETVAGAVPVQQILNELNDPTTGSGSGQRSVENDKRETANDVSISLLPTEVGEISYIEMAKSDDIATAHVEANQVPRGVANGIPDTGALTLIAVGDELTRIRNASQGEVKRLKNATEIELLGDETSLFRIVGSDTFRAVSGNINEEGIPELFEIQFEKGEANVERIDPLGSDAPVTQSDCLNLCTECLASVGGCAPCWAALPSVVTVAGAVAYLTCITTICGIALPVKCTQCLDCGT